MNKFWETCKVAQATRPLPLVNTGNRLMASATRIRVEPTVDAIISNMQRGLLRGRDIRKNVLDVNLRSMKISLKTECGVLILFDFEATFPGIPQDYRVRRLDTLGVPAPFAQLVGGLCRNCNCIMKVAGASAQWYLMRGASHWQQRRRQ